ncbi:DUF1868 domain-containing protein [Methylobacterium sp. M6A4_1b]
MTQALPSRRRALTLGVGAALATALPCRGDTRERPPAIGTKFDSDGRVRPWPGNTIIGFTRTEPDLRHALAHLRDAARAEPVMRAFALLPEPNLHMTLLAGLDADHRRPPYWPASLDADLPLAQANAWCRDRLTGFHTGGGRFRMRPAPPATGAPVTDFSLPLSPADAGEAERLRDLRVRLCDRLDIQPPNRDAYRFHITLGYLLHWLTPDETAAVGRLSRAWLARFADALPEFLIGPPVLCRFEDMASFTPMLTLTD